MKKIEELKSYLSFKVGNELFAANVSNVINILEMVPITKVPQSPVYMLGVINLRGQVLPLIDFRVKLGLDQTEFTTNTCILVMSIQVEEKERMIGAVVDSVQEVLEINSEEINEPPSLQSGGVNNFIKGMYQLDQEKFLMILDINSILEKDEVIDITASTTQMEALN